MKENKTRTEPIDPNLSKVIQMHEKQGRKVIVNESDTKYSALLLDLVKPYCGPSPNRMELEALLSLGIVAWNLANLKKLIPEAFKILLAETKSSFGNNQDSFLLLKKLIDHKLKAMPADDVSLEDFTVEYTKGGELFVTVTSKPMEALLDGMMEEAEEDFDDIFDDTEEYINRTAFVVKPKQPFLDWLNQLKGPSLFPIEVEENTIYLAREMDSDKDIEKWLKKNFETIFSKELDSWFVDIEDWPKKMSYKMFCEWFSVEPHARVIDLEPFAE